MLGYCSACGAKIIEITIEKGKKKARFLDNYKEHIIELSNNTIMRVAVCDKCKVELVAGKSKKTANKIVENHIAYWDNKPLNSPMDYQKIICINSNTTEMDFLRKKEKQAQEIEIAKKLSIK